MKVSKTALRKTIDDINAYRRDLPHPRTPQALEALGQTLETRWALIEAALEELYGEKNV